MSCWLPYHQWPIDGQSVAPGTGLRHAGFAVWPHEGFLPDGTKHVLAESYPAIFSMPVDYGPCRPDDQHQRDAWKVLQMLLKARNQERLPHLFHINEQRVGRITDV